MMDAVVFLSLEINAIIRLIREPYNSNIAGLYKEPEYSKKVGFQAPDLAMTRLY